jgi:hypothetical protein
MESILDDLLPGVYSKLSQKNAKRSLKSEVKRFKEGV